MYSPDYRKNPKENYQNKNPELSHKNNTILYNKQHHRKIKIKGFSPIELNEKEYSKNCLLNTPVYRTLKIDNFIENNHYLPSINFKSKNQNKVYNIRKNEDLSPKSQSSFNQRIITNYISYYIDEKNRSKKNKSSTNKKLAIKKLKKDKFNMSAMSNSNETKYSNIYPTTNFSPKINLRKPVVDENEIANKNKSIIVKNKNNQNNKTFVKKKIYNSNKDLNNLELIENIIDNTYYEKINLSNKKINIKPSYKSIESNISQKPEKYNQNSEKINIFNNNIKNKYYFKIDTNSSKKNNKLIENKNMNHSYKSKNIVTLNPNTNNITFKRNDLILNSINISNIPLYSNLKYRKGLDILKRLIINQKKKIFLSIKYKLLKQKSCTNYNNYIKKIKVYNYLSNMPMNIYPSLRNYTIDNEINSKKQAIIKNNATEPKEEYNKPLRSIINQNIYQINYRDVLNENSKLKNINFIIMKENDELNKKIEFLIEQNKKLTNKPKSNNLKNENKKLNNTLKNIYIKYLLTKKIYRINNKLKEILNKFHKKASKLHIQEKKMNLLYKIIKNKINSNKIILRKFFIKYYYKSKILFYKEKYNYYNRTKKNNNCNKKDKRKLLLKIINKKIINNKINNNIVIKSIIKQWFLRTKLINMKIMLVKEENNKNIILPIETLNLLKDKVNIKEMIINNLKKDNLIKGIEKLNDIFNHNNEKDKINNSKNEDNDNHYNDYKDLNPLINKDININKNISNNNLTENLIYKIYKDKFKNENDDWIIEEKEEEQIEDNGESHTTKKDIEEDNNNEYNNKSNSFFNNENL